LAQILINKIKGVQKEMRINLQVLYKIIIEYFNLKLIQNKH